MQSTSFSAVSITTLNFVLLFLLSNVWLGFLMVRKLYRILVFLQLKMSYFFTANWYDRKLLTNDEQYSDVLYSVSFLVAAFTLTFMPTFTLTHFPNQNKSPINTRYSESYHKVHDIAKNKSWLRGSFTLNSGIFY